MKYLFIFGLFLISLNSLAQKQQADSITVPTINDSLGIITYADVRELEKFLGDIPAKYANPILEWVLRVYQMRAIEWQRRNSVRKPK